MKANRAPLPAVLLVMTTVGILLDVKPTSSMDPATQKKVINWWTPI